MKSKLTILLIACLVLAFLLVPFAVGAPDFTNFVDHIHVNTTGATATPALRVNQNGAGKIVEFLDGGTPVFSINNGGGIVASGILTQGATLSGLVVSLPTAATTATPAAIIDSASAGSNILSVRKNATPVFVVGNNGAVTGQVLQYATAGQRLYCNVTSAFTTSTVITSSTSAIATPVVAQCTLAEAATGDAYNCTYTNATGAITLRVYGNQATPVANTTPVAVSYCILGTP